MLLQCANIIKIDTCNYIHVFNRKQFKGKHHVFIRYLACTLFAYLDVKLKCNETKLYICIYTDDM